VYCGGAGGPYILNAQGKKLGRIVHGHPPTPHIPVGGADRKTPHFTNPRSPFSGNLKGAGGPRAVSAQKAEGRPNTNAQTTKQKKIKSRRIARAGSGGHSVAADVLPVTKTH